MSEWLQLKCGQRVMNSGIIFVQFVYSAKTQWFIGVYRQGCARPSYN